MSRLQNLVNSLITVILNYTDPKRLKGFTPEALLQKSPEELTGDLTRLIEETTTSYELRRSLLDYFLYELKTLKPLADKSELLSDLESNRIKTHLTKLIVNTQKLLTIEKTSSLTLNYNEEKHEEKVEIFGFIDGGTVYSTTCRSGQVIKLWHSDTLIFPSNSLDNVEAFLEQIMEEHLLPHIKAENARLREENARLREKEASEKREKEALQKKAGKFDELEERQKQLEEENRHLQEERALQLKREEASRIETESLRGENIRLHDENASLTETNSSLEKDNTRLVQENASLTASRVRSSLTGRPFVGMTALALGPNFFAPPGILNHPALTTKSSQTVTKKENQSSESPQLL